MQNKFYFRGGLSSDLFYDLITRLKFISEEETHYLSSLLNNKEFEIYMLQEALHSVLGEYLNTPFKLSQNKSVQIFGLNVFLTSKSRSHIAIKISELPEIIMQGYSFLQVFLRSPEIIKLGLEFEIKEVDKGIYKRRKKILKLIEFCHREFSDYVQSILLHGSCSDLQLTDFSDIDTFVIINAETINSIESMKRFKEIWQKSLQYIYQFDSLQHHNHMFATEFDLGFFPYHWLPPQVMERSKAIVGTSKLSIKINKNRQLIFRSFLQLTERFRDENIQFKDYNEFSLKNDISVMLLLPCLYLQSMGMDITKEDSFSHPEILKVDTDHIFPKLSKIRREWKTTLISKIVVSQFYNYFIRLYYLRFFIKKIKTSAITNNSKLELKFLNSLNILINSMSDNIINNFNER